MASHVGAGARKSTRTRSPASARAAAIALAALLLTPILPGALPPARAAGPTLDGVISSGEYTDSFTLQDGVFEVSWTEVDSNITIALHAHTTGWVALGLEPSDGMLDADMLVGYVDSGAVAHVADQYATGQNGPHPDDTTLGGTDDITGFGGAEASGWTTIEIERKLSTGDSYDKVIPKSGTMFVLWAIGDKDDFTSQHTHRGDGILTFTVPPPPPPPPSGELDGVVSTGEYGTNLTTFDTGSYELRWRVAGTVIYISMRAQTGGYVSLGIDPTNRMQGVDLSQMMPQMMMSMMGGMMGGGMMGGAMGDTTDGTAGGPAGAAAPAPAGSIREAMMGGLEGDEEGGGSTGGMGGKAPAGGAATGRPRMGAMGGPMPFDMCKEMARALQSITDVNRELLEELRKR